MFKAVEGDFTICLFIEQKIKITREIRRGSWKSEVGHASIVLLS